MKRSHLILVPLTVVCGLALPSYGVDVVNDTWSDGNRTSSGPNGISGIDSAWFSSSAGASLTVPAAGDMRAAIGTGSLSLTTYFPAVTLSVGDMLRVTWVFTMTDVNGGNVNQGFRLAIANSGGTQLGGDGASPANAAYPGYAMFMNIAGTLGNANSFQLLERTAASSDFLATGGNWASRANGATTGDPGYASGTEYTYQLTLTLDPNIENQLNIVSTMTGTGLGPNNQGFLTVSFSDTTPAGTVFDMFGLRPATSSATAPQFDTTQFRVEFIAVPEPSILALAGLGLLGCGCAWSYRRLKR